MINTHFIDPSEISKLSARDVAYIKHPELFDTFISHRPGLHVFRNLIAAGRKPGVDRSALTSVIREQINGYEISLQEKVNPLIDALESEQTFTVITAHQPVLFSGPMYVFFKAVSAIVLARQIEADNPGCRIIPVFVLGAEDHDFDEINHLNLLGQRIPWEHPSPGGPVGLMTTEGIEAVIENIRGKVAHTPHGEKLIAAMETAFETTTSYGDMSQQFLQQLLADLGVLVVQMSHPVWKKAFVQEMTDDFFDNVSSTLVSETIGQLEEKLGFSAQAMPREINLFYIEPGKRLRIEENKGTYYTVDGDLSWNESALKNAIKNNPESFSPNVILRPLYQEKIFPNLAYVGGGGEIAYWLERKKQFDHYGIPFPVLVRRDSAFFLDKPLLRRVEKLNLRMSDLWKDKDQLIRERIMKQSDQEISTESERKLIEQAFETIRERAIKIDPTLERSTIAEMTKAINSIEIMEKKMVRAEKKNQELFVQQVEYIFERLFPNNSIQERQESFISFYAMYGNEILENLCDLFNPLDGKVKVIEL